MVGFYSLLPISFDVASLLLLTFPRFVKSSTSSNIDVNSNGDMMRPCLTPLVMLNQLLNVLSSITLHGKLS